MHDLFEYPTGGVEAALGHQPDHAGAIEVAGTRQDEALADSLSALEQLEMPVVTVTELRFLAAAILWRAGLADSGERVYGRAVAGWGANVDPSDLAAAAYARTVRGDADSALALLARAVRVAPAMAPHLMRMPRFAPLRRERNFGNALQGIPPSEAVAR